MDRFSRCSQGVEGVRFADLGIKSLLFADDVVLFASLVCDLQLSLDRVAAVWSNRIENLHLQISGHGSQTE